jgi:hypothetical protein
MAIEKLKNNLLGITKLDKEKNQSTVLGKKLGHRT